MRSHLHILIVEDQIPFIMIMEKIVKPIVDLFPGSIITVSESLKDAGSILCKAPFPDIVFLDLTLKDAEIKETLAKFDMISETAPTIIVTGHQSRIVREMLEGRHAEIVEKHPLEGLKERVLTAVVRAISDYDLKRSSERNSLIEKMKGIVTTMPGAPNPHAPSQ